MVTKTKLLLIIIIILSFNLIGELVYINVKEDFDISKKNTFTKFTSMPDLSISTETTYIRERSLTDIFSIYRDDPILTEYFPSTYVYNIKIKE
jgi:hypothetical protein